MKGTEVTPEQMSHANDFLRCANAEAAEMAEDSMFYILRRWRIMPESRCEATGKIRYGHKESAEKVVAKMAAKGRGAMEAFECPDCDGWHIGHSHHGLTSFWRKLRLQIKWEIDCD